MGSCALAAGLGLAGCRSETSSGTPAAGPAKGEVEPIEVEGLLKDVTRETGLDFVHDKHETGDFRFPEINGAGLCVVDYDDDGWFDLYFAQGGRIPGVAGGQEISDQLYRNRGDGTFENVTERAGIHETGFSNGCVAGDYDNDGDVDVFVYNTGPDTMLRNNGDGTFSDVTSAIGLGDPRWGLGGAFLDYDEDGWLDLFVANYAVWSPVDEKECTIRDTGHRDYCGPSSYEGDRDILYHNNGDGTFTDVSAATGIDGLTGTGMGVAVADFNGDGLQDIYVANDAKPNRMWIQRPDHTFVDRGKEMMCDVNEEGRAESSMGVVMEDFDGNGYFDLLMTHFWDESDTLYLNQGDLFKDATRVTQLRTPTLRYTSFGISAMDLRNDGGMQLYIANGKANMASKIIYKEGNPYAELDQVLEWSFSDRRFTDITDRLGPVMKAAEVSRGTALVDYDNDGDMDLVITHNAGPVRMLRSDAPASNHWLEVRCIGPDGRRDAYGAVVEVEVGGKSRRRAVYVASSYASSGDPRVHFGLGAATAVDRLTVEWVDGSRSTWRSIPADAPFTARYEKDHAEAPGR